MWSSRSILLLPCALLSLCVTAILHTKSKRNQKTWLYIRKSIIYHIYVRICVLRLYSRHSLCVVLFALLLTRSIFSSWLSGSALFIVATPRSPPDSNQIEPNRVESLIRMSTCWQQLHVHVHFGCVCVCVSGV
ncbi:uncharacterized protein [Drosophila pseudoobscura]|uniref:Secreted protein n=1 Tax=Drosophila pseudoobscura pseudoobscura TaxID=46245 RepID=A0A6I8W082_DROPS|nr:uncharacterized protein LOC117184238 [Drosophila pseudoobscura]